MKLHFYSDGRIWVNPELTDEQYSKCLLLGIRVYERIGEPNGEPFKEVKKYVVTTDAVPHRNLRRIDSVAPIHVYVETIDEAIQMATDPEKYGGHWAL